MSVLLRQNISPGHNSALGVVTINSNFTADTLSGSLLLCICAASSNHHLSDPAIPTSPSISTPGISWTQLATIFTAPYVSASTNYIERLTIYYAINAPAVPSTSITTVGSSAGISDFLEVSCKLLEYTGFSATAALGSVLTANGIGGSPTAGPIAASSAGLVFATATDYLGATDLFPAGSGFSIVSNGGVAVCLSEQAVAPTGGGGYVVAFGGVTPSTWAIISFFVSTDVAPPPTPVLQVAPLALNYSAQVGGSNPSSQNISVTNGGSGTLNWSDVSDQGWLSAAPASGTDTGTVAASVNITGLTAGTYTGHLTFSAPGASGSPQIVTVTLTIVAAVLQVTPLTLNYSAQVGGANPLPQTVSVSNGGGGTLTWSDISDQLWLTPSVSSGVDLGTVGANVDITGLAIGSYVGHLTFTAIGATGSPKVVTVNLSVTAVVPVPILQVLPPFLVFNAVQDGANPLSQNVFISNGNGGTLNWVVVDDQPWLSLAPGAGTNAGTVVASVDITGLIAGVFSANITVTAVGATGSPDITPVTLNLSPPVTPPPDPPCPFTLDDADAALAARLYDTSGQFWPPEERFACIIETLQTWNALTGYWRDDFVFPSDPSTQWYDLTQVANTLRPLTMTDLDLVLRMEQDLLEPATAAYPLVWTGSAQFAVTDLLGAIQRRRDDLLGLSGCAVSRSTVPAVSGRITLSDHIAELRRVAFVPDASFGDPSLVWQDDLWSLDSYSSGWPQLEPGIPDTYRQSTTPPRSFEVNCQPGVPGNYELLTIDNGATLSTTVATLLGIPDDWAWVIKWGALADLLSRESNAKDTVRAKYCETRYRQGLALLTVAPALLGLRCNNVPMRIDAVAVADRYRTGWESETPGTPELALVASLNLIAVVPEASNASATFTATVVENAPLPSVLGDCITVTRDLFDILLDYAQHIAAFKMGGAEFLATLPLLERFMRAAAYYNSKLAEQGEFMKPLYELSGRDSAIQPRYSDATPEDANG